MIVALFAILGLIFGSFFTVVGERVPRKESIVAPGSRCPRCGTELRARDNIPVLSYLLLRGRCRSCGERISPLYPVTEVATAALFAGAAVVYEDLFAAGVVALFLGVMFVLGLIDARHRVVPNRVTYPALALFGAALLVGDLVGSPLDVVDGGIGLAAYAGPLFLLALLLPGGMGMGDVKLAALIGLVLGALGLGLVAVAAGFGILAGGVGAIVAMVAFRYGRREAIPFGPYLAGGAIASAFVGRQVADAYLSLLS